MEYSQGLIRLFRGVLPGINPFIPWSTPEDKPIYSVEHSRGFTRLFRGALPGINPFVPWSTPED